MVPALPDGLVRPASRAQVSHLHAEFESVSAPMASMTLPNLTKFQTRVLRKHGDKLMKHLKASNPIHSLGKKGAGDKDLRDQAKKTSVLGCFRPAMLLCRNLSFACMSLREPRILLTPCRLPPPSPPSVFRKLGYWDEELKQPHPEKTVTFDEWLALVYKCKVNRGAGGTPGSGGYTPSALKLSGRYGDDDLRLLLALPASASV